MFIKPIIYFAVRKFVCTPGATTNIYGRKYKLQGQFSNFRGKCSDHFASHILGYNGLEWGQEANPVANKSECIREGYALRKSLKGLK